MNLETKLNDCLNDVLRSAGYMFEVMSKNKKQSNFITGANNQLIPPIITAQLGSSISKFDDLLDETTLKFDYAKWCVESILESRQKQEELKLKEEVERQRKVKEEEDRKRREEEEVAKRKQEEENKRKEVERKKLEEEQQKEREKDRLAREEAEKQAKQDKDLFDDFINGDFDFNMDMGVGGQQQQQQQQQQQKPSNDIPNPTDILSTVDYDLDLGTGKDKPIDSNNFDTKDSNDKEPNKDFDKDLDLDINNILGNNDSILDGLNMSLLDQGDEFVQQTNSLEEDFDVDNFLNQFAGND